MKICVTLLMTMSIMINSMNTPLSMGLCLLIQTIFTCISMRLLTNSSWMPLTMFLMMVSGLMIIFMYVTSICSNNKFKFLNINKMLLLSMPLMFILNNFNSFPFNNDSMQLSDLFNNEFTKLYSYMNIFSSLFMFMYLLIVLIVIVNLISNIKGPLRKKY
uniref:NADH dehydrogenase subunit 6 n=1 Tax=Aacanthocnema dobsoni TaxID=399255 RepID=A0A344A210_9HEMI|nr:NADH dehydrogenase subunit 6 [Aacanthocnema dobsoni]AWU48801.1 NADH dehydrogenase subunit 6 [Aacanthocnema dobsoni]